MTSPAGRQSEPPKPEWQFGFLPQLDGFRGLSILLVVIGHAFFWEAGPQAGLGVMMFFILSGFLITSLLCKELQSTGHISLKSFYLRRALRIFPAFFALIAGMAILMRFGYITDVPWYAIAAACLYLANIFGRGESIAHLWSLSLEEQFYAGWPLILRSFGLRRALWAACASIVAVIFARAVVIYLNVFPYYSPAVYIRPWFRFDALMIGCCIALLLYHVQPSHESVTRWIRWTPPLIIFPILWFWSRHGEEVLALRPIFLTVQMLLAASILLYLVALPTSFAAKLMKAAPFRFLGRISYSVYLWQQMFLMTHNPNWGWVRRFPWNIAAALCAGIASHFLIERPFLKLKNRFANATTATSANVANVNEVDVISTQAYT